MKVKNCTPDRASELAGWLQGEPDSSRDLQGSALDEEECMRAEIALAAMLGGSIDETERAHLCAHVMQCDICMHVAIELLGDAQLDALEPTPSSTNTKPDRHCGDQSAPAEITLH